MAFRSVHTAEENAGTLRLRAVQAMVVEALVRGVSAAPTARMQCVGFAPSPWFAELPPDTTGYLSGFLTACGRKPAGGAEK